MTQIMDICKLKNAETPLAYIGKTLIFSNMLPFAQQRKRTVKVHRPAVFPAYEGAPHIGNRHAALRAHRPFSRLVGTDCIIFIPQLFSRQAIRGTETALLKQRLRKTGIPLSRGTGTKALLPFGLRFPATP